MTCTLSDWLATESHRLDRRTPTAADVERLRQRIPCLSHDPQYDAIDYGRWIHGFEDGTLQPLADAVLAASIADDSDAVEDLLDLLSQAMAADPDGVPIRRGARRSRVRFATAADAAEHASLSDDSRPVLAIRRDGDGPSRWYVPHAAGLLVVEVAT